MKPSFIRRCLPLLQAFALPLLSLLAACTDTAPQLPEPTPATAAPVSLEWCIVDSILELDPVTSPILRTIRAETQAQLRFTAMDADGAARLKARFSAGNPPDLLTLREDAPLYRELMDGRQLASLTDLAAQYAPNFYDGLDSESVRRRTDWDGGLFGFPGGACVPQDYLAVGAIPSVHVFVVRRDIYDGIGSPDMSTPEGFLTALRRAREGFPQTGGELLIPFGCGPFTSSGNASLTEGLMDFLAIPREQDGVLYDRITDPDYKLWLETLRAVGEEGLLNSAIFTDTPAQIDEKIACGRYFALLLPAELLERQQIARSALDANTAYIAIPAPSGSAGAPPTLAGADVWGDSLTAIPRGAARPGEAVELMAYLVSERGRSAAAFGTTEPPPADRMQNEGKTRRLWMLESPAALREMGLLPSGGMRHIVNRHAQYTVDVSDYRFRAPASGTAEALAQDQLAALWGETLPRLLLSPTGADFEAAWQEFLVERELQGYEALARWEQEHLRDVREAKGEVAAG